MPQSRSSARVHALLTTAKLTDYRLRDRQADLMYGHRDRGDAPIPPLTRAKARLARTATPTSSFSVPVPA